MSAVLYPWGMADGPDLNLHDVTLKLGAVDIEQTRREHDAWLNQDFAQGVFDLRTQWIQGFGVVLHYRFTEADTAVHFKLRFG